MVGLLPVGGDIYIPVHVHFDGRFVSWSGIYIYLSIFTLMVGLLAEAADIYTCPCSLWW